MYHTNNIYITHDDDMISVIHVHIGMNIDKSEMLEVTAKASVGIMGLI